MKESTSCRPSLRAISSDDLDAAKKRVLVASIIAMALYAGLTAWRFESTERLKSDLQQGETFLGRDITDLFSSSVILDANYGVALGIALFTFCFAMLGMTQKSREMVSFLCCCSGCCVVASLVFLITSFVVGPLCVIGEDCGERIGRTAGINLLLVALVILYSYIWYWSYKFYKTHEFFQIESNISTSENGYSFRDHYVQPGDRNRDSVPVAEIVEINNGKY